MFEYDIFPPALVGSRIVPDGRIAIGCTVVQRLGVGLLFIESATRVIDVWSSSASQRGAKSAGFAYVTLLGHPERGVATFEVQQEREAVFVVLTARSVPGTLLTTVGRPVMRFVQRAITRRAVRRLVAPPAAATH